MSTAPAPTIDMNAAIDHYINLRDYKAKLDAEHKARVAEVDAQMKNAEAFFLHHMNETGQKNAGFASGTVIVGEKVMPGFADKAAAMQYIKDTDSMALLSVRLSSTAVKEYMEAHNGELPPGVKVAVERTVSIRRK